jgi:hypothetical protein
MEYDFLLAGTITGDEFDAMRELARPAHPLREPKLIPYPCLNALRRLGTKKIYADTADIGELKGAISIDESSIYSDVDGNTINQPLVHNVIREYLDQWDPQACSDRFGFSVNKPATLEQTARCSAPRLETILIIFSPAAGRGRSVFNFTWPDKISESREGYRPMDASDGSVGNHQDSFRPLRSRMFHRGPRPRA